MKCLLCTSKDLNISLEYKSEDLIKLWKPYYDIASFVVDEFIKLYTCKSCGLEFFDPKYAGDDDFYSILGKEDWYYNHPGKTEYDFVQHYFKDGQKVLDIGCGQAVLLSKTKAKIEYTGIELSSWATKFGHDNSINIQNETIQNHAISNIEKYDVVVSFQVLEHLTELNTFIESSLVTLKKSGYFIVALPNNESFISRTPNNTFNLPPHHTILWKRKQLELLPTYFDMELVELVNETIQDVHLETAIFSSKFWFFSKLSNRSIRLIDLTEGYNLIVDKINRLKGSKINQLLEFMLKNKYKDGQSIIAVYKKK